jgi:hypothetical protein
MGDERYKRKQTAGHRSTGGEPCSSAGRKIGSEYEFKSNKVRNALFHDRYVPETVKKHLNNINGKLSVSSRRQAVEQARYLGILSAR